MTVDEKSSPFLLKTTSNLLPRCHASSLQGLSNALRQEPAVYHIPSNKEDEGIGLCAGAYMGGQAPGHHYAKHSYWCHHQHIGHANSVLPYAVTHDHQLSW